MKLGFEIRCASSLLAVVAVGSLALARPARADWPACGRGIAVAPGSQQHSAIATDGAGGAIVVWQDQRGPSVNIFARRVLATGEPDAAWPVEGRALLTDPAALGTDVEQDSPAIVSDGRGGAIVAWQDNRSPLTGTDLYAQHALAKGVVDPRWPVNGAPVCTAAGAQQFLAITATGSGAIITWQDDRSPLS